MEENKENKNNKKQKKYEITIKANKKGKHILPLMNVIRCILVPIYFLVKPFRYYGRKKLPDGGAVLVCNHYALFDLIYPGALTWEGIHFLSKVENTRVPVLGAVMRKVKALSANRDGNDVRVLLDSFKCLKNGDKLVIFPEGTRNKTDAEMLPFHHGAAIMAIKTKTPIIPIMIYKRPKFFRMTHILVGEPMYFDEYYNRKLSEADYAEADNKIRECMLQLRADHTEFLKKKKK